jgi:hypothetical protein
MRLVARLMVTVLGVVLIAVAVYGCVRAVGWVQSRDAFGLLARQPTQPVRLKTLDPYTRRVAGTQWFGDYFTTMVFGQASGTADQPRIVTRWERRTVTVGLLNDGGPGVEGFLRAALRQLDRLQGRVDFRLGDVHPLITVRFLDHGVYARQIGSTSVGNTRTRFFQDSQGLIRASISIDHGVQDTTDEVESTLLHELTHAIGAGGHFLSPADRRRSVMYEANTLTAWSQNDAAAIRILYSPFVTSGMSETEARAGLLRYARAGP